MYQLHPLNPFYGFYRRKREGLSRWEKKDKGNGKEGKGTERVEKCG